VEEKMQQAIKESVHEAKIPDKQTALRIIGEY